MTATIDRHIVSLFALPSSSDRLCPQTPRHERRAPPPELTAGPSGQSWGSSSGIRRPRSQKRVRHREGGLRRNWSELPSRGSALGEPRRHRHPRRERRSETTSAQASDVGDVRCHERESSGGSRIGASRGPSTSAFSRNFAPSFERHFSEEMIGRPSLRTSGRSLSSSQSS